MEHQIKITYDNDHQQPVVSSLQVAEDFNKNHKHVLETIRKMTAENSALLEMFYESSYTSSQNKELPMYLMNRDGFTFLVMGFTGKQANAWKLKYIQAFNEMEKQVRGRMTTEQKVLLNLQYSKEISDHVKEVDNRVTVLENDARLDPGQYRHVGDLVSNRVREIKDTRKLHLNKKQNGLLFQGINREIKEITGTGNRSDLRQKHYVQVCNFIHTWEPSSATMEKIKALEEQKDVG